MVGTIPPFQLIVGQVPPGQLKVGKVLPVIIVIICISVKAPGVIQTARHCTINGGESSFCTIKGGESSPCTIKTWA